MSMENKALAVLKMYQKGADEAARQHAEDMIRHNPYPKGCQAYEGFENYRYKVKFEEMLGVGCGY